MITLKKSSLSAMIEGEKTPIATVLDASGRIKYNEEDQSLEIIGGVNNEGGGVHEYSTEEKVVGKWVDGRNVYERTYIGDAYPSKRLDLGTISNFDGFISSDCSWKITDSAGTITYFAKKSEDNEHVIVNIGYESNNLFIAVDHAYWSYVKGFLINATVRYIKAGE